MKYTDEKAFEIIQNKGVSFAAAQKWKENNEIPDKYFFDSSPVIDIDKIKEWYALKGIMGEGFFNLKIWANLSDVNMRILYGRDANERLPTERELSLLKDVLFEKIEKLKLLLLTDIGENEATNIIDDSFFMWNRITGEGYTLKRQFVLFKEGHRKTFPHGGLSHIKKSINNLLKITNEIKN